MNEPLRAAWEVSQFLTQQDIPHVVIGGLAVQEWGGAPQVDHEIEHPRSEKRGALSSTNPHDPSRMSCSVPIRVNTLITSFALPTAVS